MFPIKCIFIGLCILPVEVFARYFEDIQSDTDSDPAGAVYLFVAVGAIFFVKAEFEQGIQKGLRAIFISAVAISVLYLFPIILYLLAVIIGICFLYEAIKG